QAVVTAVRNVRNQQQLADGVHLTVSIQPKTVARGNELRPHAAFIEDRANCDATVVAPDFTKASATVTSVVGDLKVHVWLQNTIDLAAFKATNLKRLAALEKNVATKQARLDNADYLARAPAQQVQDTRDLLAKELLEIANLKETLAGL
ncbi:MAG: hypothetical protein H0X45_13165, partial [Planctomycetes bacterium]|nr:hypothetical protein [Planctomycetota bacterium]